MLNDNKINRISLFASIIIHVAIIIFSLATFSTPIKIANNSVPVPIKFSVEEIIIEKPILTPKINKPTPSPKPSQSLPTKLKDDRQKPLLDTHKDPYYPKEAINFSFEGTVIVNVLVNTQGRVSDIKIVSSSGHTILDDAFIAAIKSTYIFKPKRIDGVNVTDTVTLSHTFHL